MRQSEILIELFAFASFRILFSSLPFPLSRLNSKNIAQRFVTSKPICVIYGTFYDTELLYIIMFLRIRVNRQNDCNTR